MECILLTLVLIGLVGGLITGVSPCVLPVLPVLFFTGGTGRAKQPAKRSPNETSAAQRMRAGSRAATSVRTRPPIRDTAARSRRPYAIVAGLTISFSVFTLLGTLLVSALPIPSDTIRWVGLVLLVLLGIAMIFPPIEALLEKPFARLGRRQVDGDRGGFVLGLALGAVYVPCAGPVLAAITVAGASGHIGVRTVALTLSFAVGTAIPLLFFALAGRTVADRVRAFRERQRGFRIVAGVVVIGLAVALTFNVTDVLQRTVPDYTAGLNNNLNDDAQKALQLGAREPIEACAQAPTKALQNCGAMPKFAGISSWLNTADDKPVTAASLKGKVVLIDFWAYSCINCQRAIPHVEAWYSRYRAAGLEVIGVHTPEYAFEHDAGNVASGGKRLGITYPIALDNDYGTWNNFHNQAWPAEYLIDSRGQVRHAALGEGDYGGTETLIRTLLQAAHPAATLPKPTEVTDTTPNNPLQTPETYLGSQKAGNNANAATGRLDNGTQNYVYPEGLPDNSFALSGPWTVDGESITAGKAAAIQLSFNASNVYLNVGGIGTVTARVNGTTKTYRVSGAPNIYTVVHRDSPQARVLALTLSPGLRAYSFTFG